MYLLAQQLKLYNTSRFITDAERPILAQFEAFIDRNPTCFDRSNVGHITSSIWIVNAQKTHALLTHHKKLNIWVQLGGHNDGNNNCKQVALKEAQEESGITSFNFLSDSIFDIDIHPIPGSCTFHYDIRYLLRAPPQANFIISDESHNLAWIPFDQIKDYTTEQSVVRLNEKFLMHFINN